MIKWNCNEKKLTRDEIGSSYSIYVIVLFLRKRLRRINIRFFYENNTMKRYFPFSVSIIFFFYCLNVFAQHAPINGDAKRELYKEVFLENMSCNRSKAIANLKPINVLDGVNCKIVLGVENDKEYGLIIMKKSSSNIPVSNTNIEVIPIVTKNVFLFKYNAKNK